MAARKTVGTKDKPWSDRVRAKIQTSMLINRLTDNAKGKVDLKNSQVKSIDILLRKVLPDLSAVTLKGDPDNPLVITSKEQKDAAVKAAIRAKS